MGRTRGRMMSVSKDQHAVLWKAYQASGMNYHEVAAKAGLPYKRVWSLLKLTGAKSTDRECQAPTLQGVLFALGNPLRFDEFEHIPAPISGADEVKLIYAYRRLREARRERAYGAVRDMVRWADEAEAAVAKDSALPDAATWEEMMSEAAIVLPLRLLPGEAQSPAKKTRGRKAAAKRGA